MKKGEIVSLCVLNEDTDTLAHYADAEVKTLTDEILVLYLVNMRNVFLSMGSVLFNSVHNYRDKKDKTVEIPRDDSNLSDYADGFLFQALYKATIILPKNTYQKVDMNASLVAVVYGEGKYA